MPLEIISMKGHEGIYLIRLYWKDSKSISPTNDRHTQASGNVKIYSRCLSPQRPLMLKCCR
jgi:hypothetical protein